MRVGLRERRRRCVGSGASVASKKAATDPNPKEKEIALWSGWPSLVLNPTTVPFHPPESGAVAERGTPTRGRGMVLFPHCGNLATL